MRLDSKITEAILCCDILLLNHKFQPRLKKYSVTMDTTTQKESDWETQFTIGSQTPRQEKIQFPSFVPLDNSSYGQFCVLAYFKSSKCSNLI